MDRSGGAKRARRVGVALIAFAIGFNLPYIWLASSFDYPAILRSPPGVILAAFAEGGTPLILGWAAFALAALLFAPVAVAVAMVTRRRGFPSAEVAALGIAAGVTQAIGLSRWVYAVPGLASHWAASAADPGPRAMIEIAFTTLHQFAGVGIGEAIGQSLTAFWLIGVALGQRRHPRFGGATHVKYPMFGASDRTRAMAANVISILSRALTAEKADCSADIRSSRNARIQFLNFILNIRDSRVQCFQCE